ncbi:MAG: hypothetical protein KKD66_12345, partial [Proteobacteria bacterium]|nr:hypothetical protein [Pseudomonadota bacterium]
FPVLVTSFLGWLCRGLLCKLVDQSPYLRGFGVERLLMISKGDTFIGKWGKNLSYLDGIRLSI